MILRYLRPKDWGVVAFCVVLVVIQVYLDLEIPGYMSSITLTITTEGSVDAVMEDGIWMIACALGSLIASIAVGALAAFVATSLSRKLRKLEFDRVESFSEEEMNRFSTASLITRSTNDISQIQMAMAIGLQVMIKAPIMAVWAITKIYGKSWEWTATTAVAVVLLMAILAMVMLYAIPRFKRIQGLTDDVNRVTRENLTGLRVVRAYNAESYQEAKSDRANAELTDVNLSANRAMATMMPSMSMVLNGLSLAIYWIGAMLISAAGFQDRISLFSDMVVFSSYAMQVVMSFIMLVMIFMILPRAMVASRRVQDVIGTVPSIVDGGRDGGEPGMVGTVSFRDVDFSYPGAADNSVCGISFDVSRGETLAIIGPTGSGKSTIINLIPRFYDATSGSVLVDGVDVREYDLGALRSRIGYVPQKSFMFAGTIDSNVRYGSTSSERTVDDVRRAIEIAQAADFVHDSGEGLDSVVSQGGANLSGGQKQRLSIARAICRSPEIYIFDDTFSALDYRTDRVLRRALEEETRGITKIIVAQRIGTIMDADRILVLEDGRIVGSGRHEELLRSCPQYLDIARSQLSEQELGL